MYCFYGKLNNNHVAIEMFSHKTLLNGPLAVLTNDDYRV